MAKIVLLLFLFLIPRAMADFQAGCAAYEAGNFAEALKEFKGEASVHLSAELAYNLGCTELKLKQPGHAALWFQRALLLDPRHKESAQNLRFLKKSLAFVNFDVTTMDLVAKLAPLETWRAVTWISFWIVMVCASVLYFLRTKRLWHWVSLLVLAVVAGGISLASWVTRSHQIKPHEISIVMDEEGVSALNVPAETADKVIAINAGSQVRRLETRGDWTYIELPGDHATRGWVRTATLEPLWPFQVPPAA